MQWALDAGSWNDGRQGAPEVRVRGTRASPETQVGNDVKPSSHMPSEKVDLVRLNVGGTVFITSTATLQAEVANPPALASSQAGIQWWLETERKLLSQGLVASRPKGTDKQSMPGAEVVEVFVDRNPQTFSAVLDFLRTGRLLLPPSVTHEMAEEELRYFGLSTPAMELKDVAIHTIEVTYGEHVSAFVRTCRQKLRWCSVQGRLRVSIGLVVQPFGIGIHEGHAMEACQQMCALFDHGEVNADLAQVMSIRECRWEASRRLEEDGICSTGGYGKGNVYATLAPVHVWFVAGFDKDIVRDAAAGLEASLSEWEPSGLSTRPHA